MVGFNNARCSSTRRGREERKSFIYERDGLQLLTRVWQVFQSDEEVMAKLASILLNVSQDHENHSLLVSGGFLHLLVGWKKSSNNDLVCTGTSAPTLHCCSVQRCTSPCLPAEFSTIKKPWLFLCQSYPFANIYSFNPLRAYVRVCLASPFIHCYWYLVAVNWGVRDDFLYSF